MLTPRRIWERGTEQGRHVVAWSCRVLSQRLDRFVHWLPLALIDGDNLHLFPVVRKFLTALETYYIGSGHCSSRTVAAALRGDWKAVVRMRAPKQRVKNVSKHRLPPSPTTARYSCSLKYRFVEWEKGSSVQGGVCTSVTSGKITLRELLVSCVQCTWS